MNKQAIKELALANGFKLKEQPDGSIDLNPYLYEFALALMAEAGRAGYLKGADDWKSFEQVFDSDIKVSADEYAATVRQGGE